MGEGGERILSTAEMPRNTEVESGAPEQQTATYQRGNSTQEGISWQQGKTTEKFGGLVYKIKCRRGKAQLKRTGMRPGESKTEISGRTDRL
jgi:hypothetical protein